MTIFLRFESKEQWESFSDLVYDTALDRDGNEIHTAKSGFTFDVIGTIWNHGAYDSEGNVITPPTAEFGFHVNMLGEVPEEFEPFLVYPASPSRLFFI